MSSELRLSVCNRESDSGLRAGQPSRGSRPSRVFIDATYTLGSGRRSGIERVVTNLRLGCEQRATASGLRAATLMSVDGDFYEVGPREKRALDQLALAQSNIVASFPPLYRQLMRPLLGRVGSVKLNRWFLPEPGHMGIFKLPHRFWYKRAVQKICHRTQLVEPTRGDLLILPDAYWARKDIWRAAAAARARGATVAIVVYDLIPLSHPEFVGPRRSQRFQEYLRQVAQQADVILAISETVRRELVDTLPDFMSGAAYCQNIQAFTLGSELSNSQGEPRSELVRLFGGSQENQPYLTVAAFDPRKNHRYLLDAFDRFWQLYPERKLCLIGRTGSRCNDILERIENHPRLGRQLFAFHDLSDAELQYCYQSCHGVIFPSIVEGFGLPIVEALWHGHRTLASDTPIHREVGGDKCWYFDLASPDALVQLLIQCEQNPQMLAQTGPRHVGLSWKASTEAFLDKCLDAYQYSLPHSPLARSA